MSPNENNTIGKPGIPTEMEEVAEHSTVDHPQDNSPVPESTSSGTEVGGHESTLRKFATRAGIKSTEGLGKNKLLLLGGGLLAAILFFIFTALAGKHSRPIAKPEARPSQTAEKPKGSITPLMNATRQATSDDSSGQLSPEDINRNRSTDGRVKSPHTASKTESGVAPQPATAASLGNVPSFADTQQRWEEPRPYGEPPTSPVQSQQQQNALKEPSLVFVRSETQVTSGGTNKPIAAGDGEPMLELTPGSRILAKLKTVISSADPTTDVVAEVEYTYAIGDQVVVPAGAWILGKLQQADRSGYVSVKFNEIESLDRQKQKIDAVGLGLDMGPIKGIVTGKNTGKNLLVRSISGIGSVLAEVAGNNSSGAFSEEDLLRERLAENIGTAGDSELMGLAVNSRVVVSVPANTEIYVVFNEHDSTSPTLHRVASSTP
jgi:hypothetical protein